MKKSMWHHRLWLALIAALLLIAPAAFAQEDEQPPAEEEEVEETSGSWVISWELDAGGTSYTIVTTDGETEATTVVEVTDEEGDGIDHGDHVRSFEEAVPEGPGRGCIISEVARSDAGKAEVDDDDDDAEEANPGCPDGLYEWLNSEEKGSGPPPWADRPNGEEMDNEDDGEADEDGEDESAATSGRPANVGPPAGVGGPP